MDELLRPGNLPLGGDRNEKEPAGKVLKEKYDQAAAGMKKAVSSAGRVCRTLGASAAQGALKAGASLKSACVSAAGTVKAKTAGLPAAAREAGRKAAQSLRTAGGRAADAVAQHPVSPMLYLTVAALLIGIFLFQSTYIQAYAVNVDGVEVGLVTDTAQVEAAVTDVENRVASIVGRSYDLDAEVTFVPVYSTQSELTDASEIEAYLYDTAAPDIDAYYEAYYASIMQACVLTVDGQEMGLAASEEDMNAMLDRVAEPFITSATVDYGFTPDIALSSRQMPSDTEFDTDAIYEALTAHVVEEAVYVVQKGDTFSRIAKNLEMSIDELSDLNPDVIIDKIWVGDELVIRRSVPFLSVWTVDNTTYEQIIESPVEYTETDSLYKGDTKVIEHGEDGLALVNADVKYVNGYEEERTILSSETLQEPTVTKMLKGTKPRPKTASKGTYIWPVSGKITSRFGNRASGYHTGLDIAVPTGTNVKAADGGTVTRAGWAGGNSYGWLVVITHDNGAQTYYAHNSKLLVKVGDKVYQGQTIAKSGSTGNSTGPHVHFEIRIGGKAKNPLNYL